MGDMRHRTQGVRYRFEWELCDTALHGKLLTPTIDLHQTLCFAVEAAILVSHSGSCSTYITRRMTGEIQQLHWG